MVVFLIHTPSPHITTHHHHTSSPDTITTHHHHTSYQPPAVLSCGARRSAWRRHTGRTCLPRSCCLDTALPLLPISGPSPAETCSTATFSCHYEHSYTCATHYTNEIHLHRAYRLASITLHEQCTITSFS